MKSILLYLLLFSINLSHGFLIDDKVKFSVEIWDADFSTATSILYRITHDSLRVKQIGTLEGEADRFLTKRTLTSSECQMFIEFFSSTNLDTLKSEYIDRRTSDGDRKVISIVLDDKRKRIEIANTYVPEIARLITLINKTLPSNSKITYKTE